MDKMYQPAITLYSFSSDYITGKLSLEDCLKEARDMGFTAIELVASQMIPEYPYPSDEWIAYFKALVAKYDLEPLCYSAYIDMGIRSDRDLTDEEIFHSTLNDMLYARRLGFKFVRTQHAISPKVFQSMLPYCRQIGVKLAIEMHAPHNPEVPVWQEYLAIMDASDGQLGVVPDFGIFAEKPHELLLIQAVEDFGCRREIVDLVVDHFSQGLPQEELARHQLSEAEQKFAEEVYKNHGPARLDWLDRLVPHSFYMHGKYWYLKDEHDDSGVPYQRILHRLTELGYSGYIACEYEGHHFRDDIDVKDQLQKFARLLTS
ncbi:MAG: TIM barrel protein [Bacillota bacterium]|jgi:sugar phosphate isomerase/epimerase|nr:TIM barrel protein [Bacillota bacterium]HHT91021.1 TIM barrel protein [Bacillota bacterium]